MAKEQDETVTEEPGRNPKKWWLMGGGAVLILIVAAVIAMLMPSESNDEGHGLEANALPEHNLEEALYVSLPRNLIFNVTGADRDRVAQIGVQFLVRGPRNETLAQENIPMLEATLLDIFSRATAERLNTSEGKREIRLLALDAVQIAMRDATNGSPVVDEVLFTNFVMQ